MCRVRKVFTSEKLNVTAVDSHMLLLVHCIQHNLMLKTELITVLNEWLSIPLCEQI